MNNHYRIFLLCILYALVATTSAQEHKEYYFRFPQKTITPIDSLTQWMSIDNIKSGYYYAYANTRQWKSLQSKLQNIEQLPHPSSVRLKNGTIEMASTPSEMSNWDKYPTYSCYQSLLQSLAQNPHCDLFSIGKSVKNRDIYMLEITGTQGNPAAKPGVFLTSTMHGDETAGYVLMLRLADYLLSQYGTNNDITTLLDNTIIYINPLANPDGTYNNGDNTVIGSTRFNANGVDLNRNFPALDGAPHPDNERYQPETTAMMNWTHKASIALAANFHGGAEVVNYPWDSDSRLHPDNNWFIDLSATYAQNTQSNGPDNYFTSVSSKGYTNGYQWYQTQGSRQDYMTYHRQIREVTIEISNTKLFPSNNLPDMWLWQKDALLDFIRFSQWGINGTITDEHQKPVDAEIFIRQYDKSIDSSMVFSNSQSGNFVRLLPAGTYEIEIKAPWYIDSILTPITLGQQQAESLNIQLIAQDTVAFSGIIHTAETGTSLPDAEIKLIGENKNYRQVTNEQGQFSFAELPAQIYSLSIKAENHISYTNDLGLWETINDFSHTLVVSGTGIAVESTEKWEVYPIPATNYIMVNANEFKQQKVTLQLYNLQGQQLQSMNVGKFPHKMDLSNYPTGMYYLVVQEEFSKRSFPIIKL